MIENSERTQSMLNNIIDMVTTIQNDFNRNGATHYDYILEKLNSAQWDLDVLISMAKSKKSSEKVD